MNRIIITQVAVLGVLMLVGMVARKTQIINDTISKGLSNILVNIALPAMIISAFEISFSKEMFQKVLLILLISIVLHFLFVLLAKSIFKKYPEDKKNVFHIFFIFPNAGFMGLPFIQAIYGEMAVLYASVFLIPHHILLWTYGQGLFMKEDQKEKKIDILKHIKNPAVLAVIIGFILFIFSIKIPYLLSMPMSMLGALTSPLAMMIVGDKIAQIYFRDIFSDKDVYYGSLYRLVVLPILTMVLVKFLTQDPLLIQVCVTLISLPSAITTVIFPQKFNGDSLFGSKCVVVSHILSIITIPIILSFI